MLQKERSEGGRDDWILVGLRGACEKGLILLSKGEHISVL
jgi:hypothetical protein